MPPKHKINFDSHFAQVKERAIKRLITILNEGIGKDTSPFSAVEYGEVYDLMYEICTSDANHTAPLYEKHGLVFKDYLTGYVVGKLKTAAGKGELLREFLLRWENNKIMNKWLIKFFTYLDKFYVPHNKVPSLHQSGLDHFKKDAFDEMKKPVAADILKALSALRAGELVDDRAYLNKCVEVFEVMGMGKITIYESDLETPYLGALHDFYSVRGGDWLKEDSMPSYLAKVENALEAEKNLVNLYLKESTKPKVVKVIQDVLLILDNGKTLLHKEGSGLKVQLTEKKHEVLSRLFRLYNVIDKGLDPISDIVEEDIKEKGRDLITKREVATKEAAAAKDAKDKPSQSAIDMALVDSLLVLHSDFRRIVTEDFEKHAILQRALQRGFEDVMNQPLDKNSLAELLQNYTDRLLKSGSDIKLSEVELGEKLEDVKQLFAFLSEKDLYIEFYRNSLAKRLLDNKSISTDAETNMISKLKLLQGKQFVSKLEGMINDIKIGSDHKAEFQAFLSEDKSPGKKVEFTTQILTSGFWPSYKAMDVALPEEMQKCVDTFKTFYDKGGKNSGKILQWLHILGSASLKMGYGKASYEVNVNTLQAVGLLLFRTKDTYNFEEFKKGCNIDDDSAKKVLHSISCGKFKILNKAPVSKSIATTDTFTINKRFSDKKKRFAVPMAPLVDSFNAKKVEEDRGFIIEAMLVRVMKARKTHTHAELIADTLKNLSTFKPAPRDIKAKIEGLIQREYLKRRDGNPNEYEYLA